MELERTHKTAETVGKIETGLGVLVVFLHVLTLTVRRPSEGADDDEMTAPGSS